MASSQSELEQQIHRHFKQHGQFSSCLNSFDKALGESRLPVPAGQSSHLLWHTFASRFVMNGGNILTQQKILGHTTPAMALRYTHLAPDHLQDAIMLGPLAITGAFSASSPHSHIKAWGHHA